MTSLFLVISEYDENASEPSTILSPPPSPLITWVSSENRHRSSASLTHGDKTQPIKFNSTPIFQINPLQQTNFSLSSPPSLLPKPTPIETKITPEAEGRGDREKKKKKEEEKERGGDAWKKRWEIKEVVQVESPGDPNPRGGWIRWSTLND